MHLLLMLVTFANGVTKRSAERRSLSERPLRVESCQPWDDSVKETRCRALQTAGRGSAMHEGHESRRLPATKLQENAQETQHCKEKGHGLDNGLLPKWA
eukprot:4102640-Pleurochrysis_carterae.AAC.3